MFILKIIISNTRFTIYIIYDNEGGIVIFRYYISINKNVFLNDTFRHIIKDYKMNRHCIKYGTNIIIWYTYVRRPDERGLMLSNQKKIVIYMSR